MGKQACRCRCHGRFEWDAHGCQAPFTSSARAMSFDRTPCRMMTAQDMRPALGTIPAQRPAAPCVLAKCCSVDLRVAYSGCSYTPSHLVSADALLCLPQQAPLASLLCRALMHVQESASIALPALLLETQAGSQSRGLTLTLTNACMRVFAVSIG